jgi:hypothetical protein
MKNFGDIKMHGAKVKTTSLLLTTKFMKLSRINNTENKTVTCSEITSPSWHFIPISIITLNYSSWLL